MEEKIEVLADALEWDASKMSPETPLDELGWDSMTMLTVVAVARAAGKTISGDQIRVMATVGDLLAAI